LNDKTFDGEWCVCTRFAGKECMFVMAPIRYKGGGEVEELPVEFCEAQGMDAKSFLKRKQQAQKWEDELNSPDVGDDLSKPPETTDDGYPLAELLDDDVPF